MPTLPNYPYYFSLHFFLLCFTTIYEKEIYTDVMYHNEKENER